MAVLFLKMRISTYTSNSRGEWDPSIRIEPPDNVPAGEDEKDESPGDALLDEQELMKREREKSGLMRTGIPFGGLVADIKRKLPWYVCHFM